MNVLKTTVLLAALTALFMGVGYLIGGRGGAGIAFVAALTTNLFTYWNSGNVVLRMFGAREITGKEQPDLYGLVQNLTRRANLPMPRVYLIDNPQPNAFATGRNANHAAVAVHTGLLDRLERDEVEAVISHELGHIKNHDTLIMTLTATLAGAISMLAQFGLFFGGGNNRNSSNPLGFVGVLLAALVAPLAAMLVQMAVSRTREYAADKAGAEISGMPLALASALQKISADVAIIPNESAERHPAAAHLFIINPLSGLGMDNLFSTHPDTQNRVAALQAIARRGEIREPSAGMNDNTPWQDAKDLSTGDRSGPWA